jgi:DNA-directed RNA polymerase specialized sigma subunit
VINRQPATEVARRFEVSENAVYQIRNRLLRRLKAEVGMLMKSGGMG